MRLCVRFFDQERYLIKIRIEDYKNVKVLIQALLKIFKLPVKDKHVMLLEPDMIIEELDKIRNED